MACGCKKGRIKSHAECNWDLSRRWRKPGSSDWPRIIWGFPIQARTRSTAVVIFLSQASSVYAWCRLANRVSFKHSSRSLPLKLSTWSTWAPLVRVNARHALYWLARRNVMPVDRFIFRPLQDGHAGQFVTIMLMMVLGLPWISITRSGSRPNLRIR